MRLSRIGAIALVLACLSASRVEASPVLIQFAGIIPGINFGPLPENTLLTGTLVFDDLGFPQVATGGTVPYTGGPYWSPITYASITIGTHNFTMAEMFPNPTFNITVHDYGPWLRILPQFLTPLGLTGFDMSGGNGFLTVVYTWDTGIPGSQGARITGACTASFPCLVTYGTPPPDLVPEPSSLLMSLGAVLGFAAFRRGTLTPNFRRMHR